MSVRPLGAAILKGVKGNAPSIRIATVVSRSQSGAEQQPTEWIVRSTIVYVNDPVAELPLENGIRPDLPQLTNSRLEPSFVTNLHAILLGRTLKEVMEDIQNGRVGAESATIRRVASTVVISQEYSIELYVCSDELCKLLAATEDQRVTEIAHHWHTLLWPRPQPYESESESRRQFRAGILSQLVTLAREAARSDRKLMMRLEHRKHKRDADTGTVRVSQATQH